MIDLDLLRREGLFAAEAAGEIERLRAALEAIAYATNPGDYMQRVARRALEQPAAIDPRTLRERLR